MPLTYLAVLVANFDIYQYQDFTYGDGVTGTTRLGKALSRFLNAHFKPHLPVLIDHLIMGGGLSPIISQLSRVLADPGDGILLAAPYYPGFDIDLLVSNNIHPVGVPIAEPDLCTLAELDHMERGLAESNANGTVVKAVILCNPHNPLGRCYPREVIEAYCQFCERHNLHLISDEIYAFSVFPSGDIPHPQPFISALSLDLTTLGVDPSKVHVLYGMSKDFNANGFRAGVCISQFNPQVIHSLTTTSIFMLVAAPTDSLWSTFLNDDKFLSRFLKVNQLKLSEAYEYMTTWLKFHKVPYTPSSAGHFMMVDLRSVLSDIERYGAFLGITADHSMGDREKALAAYLADQKVYTMSGAACHADPGWFRFTFSVRRDFVNIALARVEKALKWSSWPVLAAKSGRMCIVC